MGAKGEPEMPKNLYLRKGTWWARFKVRGVEYRRSLRTAVRSEAERRLANVRKQVEGEALFGIVEPRSFADAVESWTRHCTGDLNAKTTKRYLSSIKQVWRHLADVHVHKIDVPKLREMVKARRMEGASTATIKRDLTAISGVLKHAADEEWMEEINPTLAIRAKGKMKEKREPIVLPDIDDVKAVKAKSASRFADAMDFARETGMRQSEIFNLKWRDVGETAITIIKAKHNSLRVIPLSAKARKIMEKQPRHIKQPYVFWHGNGLKWSSPSSSFRENAKRAQKAAQKAGQDFRWFRFHDLRHLFAVEYLRAKRGSIYDLQRIMGHTSITTTEIYLKYLTPDQVRAAMYGGTKGGVDATVSA